MNGVTQQNSLPDTTTVLPCIDDSFANKTVVFMGLVLAKAAQGSLSDVEDIASMVDDFNKQVPESAKTCLKGNQEILTVAAKYGITPDTDMLIIQAKVLAFVTFHYLDFHKELGLLNSEWVAGNYEQMGYDGAAYWHKVLQISIEDITLLRSQR